MDKIIQKDITFEMSFTFPLFGSRKALRILKKKYDAKELKKSWSWKKPFTLDVKARININHNVDITKMREKQHEHLIGNKKEKEIK